MNEFNISKKTATKVGLSIEACIFLLALCIKDSFSDYYKELVDTGYINKETEDITKEGLAAVKEFYINKDSIDNYRELAIKMQELFPKGKKPGTNGIYWRGGIDEVSAKLKNIFRLKPDLTEEQVLTATTKYIESFKGNYTYMQVLKYFILKNKQVGGVTEFQSELLSFIENSTQESIESDWNMTLK